MTKTCKNCVKTFEVTDEDLKFYDAISPVFGGKKYSIPAPTLCPECRLRNRMIFRNHTAIFQRPAFPDGKMIFSMHPETAKFPVMSNEDWASEKWDPLVYGQDFDFNRSFFEQFKKLNDRVPKYARIALRNENCDYANNLSDNKNCYMIFSMANAEDCMYCEDSWGSKDCLECTITLKSERCYDCTDCINCYNLQSSECCESCSDSHFLAFCRSCKNCFGCANLRHREYCIFNVQKTKEEYETFIKKFNGSSWTQINFYKQQFEKLLERCPRPHATMHKTEDCIGNYLTESHNVKESYFIQNGENLKYCFNLYEGARDSMDYSYSGRRAELIYESCTCVINVYNILFSMQCRDDSSNLIYCYGCDICKDCFGCSGLRRKQYCVFNKQYTKEEYEILVPKIIEHMKKTGEWGQFFPSEISPMPYNRSVAQRYFPLTKEEALKKGFTWHEEDPKQFPNAVDATKLPDGLPLKNDALIVKSAVSERPFSITTREIEKYKEFKVALPRLTYEERMNERAKKLGGIRLYERACAKSGKKILTTYAPDSKYIVWDKDEYDKEFQ
ncbi:MAG: hypothetical protein WCT36_04640 [Candidatus Gracilibacteria bacterium]